MLTSLRSKSGGWIAKIFIGLLAASFAVWGIEDMLRGSVPDRLATVGDREIGITEYRETFNRQLAEYSRRLNQTVTPDQARELGLDRQILGDLMRDAALDSQAQALGIQMPARAVAQSVANSPRFQSADGAFNADRFRQLLRSNGITEEQFFALETRNMTRQVISQPLIAETVVPETLVELIWRHRTEERDASWFEITLPSLDKQPSDAELKSLYDENPATFRVPERRTFAVVALVPDAIASSIEVSDAELAQQYEATKAAYSTPETRTVLQIPFPSEAEAQAAAAKIKAGTSFEDIARERGLSDTDITLGTVEKSAIPDPAIADAAFALADGAVSGVVNGRLSTVLLKATVVQPGVTKTLDEVRDQVAADVRTRKARDRLLDLHDKFEDARAGGATMEEAARDIALQVNVHWSGIARRQRRQRQDRDRARPLGRAGDGVRNRGWPGNLAADRRRQRLHLGRDARGHPLLHPAVQRGEGPGDRRMESPRSGQGDPRQGGRAGGEAEVRHTDRRPRCRREYRGKDGQRRIAHQCLGGVHPVGCGRAVLGPGKWANLLDVRRRQVRPHHRFFTGDGPAV